MLLISTPRAVRRIALNSIYKSLTSSRHPSDLDAIVLFDDDDTCDTHLSIETLRTYARSVTVLVA
jgi:hypothetical protein